MGLVPGNPVGIGQRMDSRFQQRIGKNRLGLDRGQFQYLCPQAFQGIGGGRRPGFWGG